MDKIPLKDLFPKLELMTVQECIKKLGWQPEKDFDKDGSTGKITCSCGEQVKTSGWFGIEHAYCPGCHKGMQDMTGFLPSSNSSGTCIDSNGTILPDDGRFWTPENIWGF